MSDTASTGWYLGLPYMHGTGLRARAPGKIEEDAPNNFLFVDEVLAFCPDWRASLESWWKHLAPGAHLVLWLPDCVKMEAAGHRFTHEAVDHALDGVDGWVQLECGSIGTHLFAVFRKEVAGQVRAPWRKKDKHLLLIRSGAYGDAIMASSVLPLLKKAGWRVDFLTGESGEEVLRHDPHLACIRLTRKNQVPDGELGAFWQAWGARYDRVINLTFSVEGELLKQPFRGDYFWGTEQRRALCNRSYLGRIHDLAGVADAFAPRFYETEEERAFARHQALKHAPFILWCLKGSAIHKWWPYTPQAVCRILANSRAKIILAGGDDAAELADKVMRAAKDYVGDSARLVNGCGKHTIRQIMALAKKATLVIGPETGVMNAVSFERVRKLVFLSHSSARNLTDDWVNTRAFVPRVPCYPCHRLHYTHEWCPEDEKTGAAACAASVSLDEVSNIVIDEYQTALRAPFSFGASRSAVRATADAPSASPCFQMPKDAA